MALEQNLGVWVHNPAPVQPEMTVAVTGLGRSGTTMVARVLTALGLYMGENLTPMSHEDKEFQLLIKNNDEQAFAELCRKRDQAFVLWGLKVPAFRSQMNQFCQHMRSPRIIVLMRDMAAISIRLSGAHDLDTLQALRKTLAGYQKLIENIASCPAPVLVISYEKALQYPQEMVQEIAAFCGLSPTPEHIKRAANEIQNGDPRYLGRGEASLLLKEQRDV